DVSLAEDNVNKAEAETPEMGNTDVSLAENVLNRLELETENVKYTVEVPLTPVEILAEFPRSVYRFHFRSRIYSPAYQTRREEAILSQIHYENPIYTQRWRKRSAQYLERLEAELQTAVLLAGSLYRLRAETLKQKVLEPKTENSSPSRTESEILPGVLPG
ncbi:MAG: hypothetical protein Q4C70_14950, partial [Planctomycetia bacterium]|nr:hypothetical protein [Planctomycetia bacterium]